jgi:PiT family inorganic phosphate transporter
METFVIGIASLLGLYMAWNIGANDVANSMADAVGSKAVTVGQAVILAGICEFAGAVLVGAPVTDTVRKGIVNPDTFLALTGLSHEQAAALFVIGMTSALLSAAIWLNISSIMGLPVSTTHSIVGAVAGFGIVAAGWSAVEWPKMAMIVASWFVSPVAGGIMAYILFKFINRFILGRDRPARAAIKYTPYLVSAVTATVVLATIYKGLKHVIGNIQWLTPEVSIMLTLVASIMTGVISRMILKRKLRGKERLPVGEQLELVERVFVPIVIITSCSVAFAHGANDVANAIGPLAAVVRVIETGTVVHKVGVPFWVLVLGGFGIVMGLATFGYRVMKTVGTDITEITPSRGVAADLAATATVLICTRLKLPISTTHTLVGAILGIGLARGLGGINKSVTNRIFGAWFVTVPAAAILCVFLFLLGKMYYFDYLTEVCTK